MPLTVPLGHTQETPKPSAGLFECREPMFSAQALHLRDRAGLIRYSCTCNAFDLKNACLLYVARIQGMESMLLAQEDEWRLIYYSCNGSDVGVTVTEEPAQSNQIPEVRRGRRWLADDSRYFDANIEKGILLLLMFVVCLLPSPMLYMSTSGAPDLSRTMTIPDESCSCDVVGSHAIHTRPITPSTLVLHTCSRRFFMCGALNHVSFL